MSKKNILPLGQEEKQESTGTGHHTTALRQGEGLLMENAGQCHSGNHVNSLFVFEE